MGFLKQETPQIDFEEWSKGTRAEKIIPMARHWAEVGFGTPVLLHLFYVVKIALYILGAWLLALTTTGINGFTNVAHWYAEPIVFEKVVLYTMLFEVVGLGCGFGPLNNRFFPPLGSILYWLRPGTIRLPPWPGRIPFTKGDNRTPFDALLYGALLVLLVIAIFSDGTGPMPALGTTVGVLPAWQIWAVLGVLAVLGLRDKVIFLAARGEVYASFTVAFLFAGYGVDLILGAKLVCLVIWLGAATSKLNKHFPFVISTMMSNNPMFRPRFIKRLFFEHFPDDLRPGWRSRWLAHFSTAIEGLVPLVLFFSHGGWPTAIAAFVMLCFHFGILSSIPMGVPLEWNVFMMFSVLALFVGHASIGLTRPDHTAADTAVRGRGRHCRARKSVPAQGFLPARHALLRGQLGHHAVVHQAVGRSKDRQQRRRDREHAGRSTGKVLRQQGSRADPDVHGICVPRLQHSRPRAVHLGAPRDGRSQRGRLRPDRR